jgi:flavin reductase (DIM6/NTAB) family NADH-FMN oxidoreductase RutF
MLLNQKEAIPLAYSQEDFIPIPVENSSHHFFNSLVIPRPIAFITTISEKKIVNAAPFSYFNIVCTKPFMISVAIERRHGIRKDTASNILLTKEFVVNVCSTNLAKTIGLASRDFPPEISEIAITGLALIPSKKIATPRIGNTLVQMECTLHHWLELGKDQSDLIIGEVQTLHLHRKILNTHGRVILKELDPLARLAGNTYARILETFEVT